MELLRNEVIKERQNINTNKKLNAINLFLLHNQSHYYKHIVLLLMLNLLLLDYYAYSLA